MSDHAATFEEYYRATDDPWGFRTRWYERRKRALTRAALPRERYAMAWEIGCANGELGATLAEACDRLLATDGNATAVTAARRRLADVSGAVVEQRWIPEEWPEGNFDLIVLSEMAYYLDKSALEHFCRRLTASLLPGGNFVACHWRPQIENCAITGEEAHAMMNSILPWKKIVHHSEDDFVLEVWSDDGQSVAHREGLR